MSVSLFASSVRPQLYNSFFKSLKGTSVDYEVVFAGHSDVKPEADNFKYIKTGRIKPAQCYEIARRHCAKEVVVWVADDCEFLNDVIGKAHKYWKSQNNEKLILSLQTKETGYGNINGTFFDMRNHSFIGFNKQTPLMAPLGMMSREFLEELGGLDRRYVCGQYENDIIMRAYQKGASVEVFGDEHSYIWIDHLKKSIKSGECTNEKGFLKRPFATGYGTDRKVLENSWCRNEMFSVRTKHGVELVKSVSDTSLLSRYDKFESYSDKDILVKSQSNRGQWD